ncbi:MAG: DeoR/GlpR transcriptional regulator [Anaerolineae bacterium]|nr:DeoR/GlpR transcriptional regulator [Anaerolineae bacterium]
MLKNERQTIILQHLKNKGSVHVTDLTALFQVDPVTVRRDLAELEATGHLQRVYGGAILQKGPALEVPAEGVATRLAEAAARLIPDKSTVFLGPGNLPSLIVPYLRNRERLTITTNALNVAWPVAQMQTHTLHVIGGQVEHDYGIYGMADALRGMRADWVILEADGLDAERGVTHEDHHYANMARALFTLGAQIMIIILPESLGHASARFVAPAGDVDILITGREAPNPTLWDLSELGVRIVLA